jgi:transposase
MHDHQGTYSLPWQAHEEETMERFHGIDRHKAYSTISVLNRDGVEIAFHLSVKDLQAYVDQLGPEDAVVLEASTGSFWWADQIEIRGSTCFVLNPYRFKIIKDSWNKTDKRDARNMAKALWVYMVTGEFGLPTVHKPSVVIREIRRLFTYYDVITRQIRMLKNGIQALLVENGINLDEAERTQLLKEPATSNAVIAKYALSPASCRIITGELDLLGVLLEKKAQLVQDILCTGEEFQNQVKLLITIRGITPLIALAFLADVGDIERFASARKMNAYLGLVPQCSDSGGKERHGHINKESRKLTRTILTQALVQVVDASPQFRKFYDEMKERRGAGRARIALIRKLCGTMRCMLIHGTEYRNKEEGLFNRKITQYQKVLKQAGKTGAGALKSA